MVCGFYKNSIELLAIKENEAFIYFFDSLFFSFIFATILLS